MSRDQSRRVRYLEASHAHRGGLAAAMRDFARERLEDPDTDANAALHCRAILAAPDDPIEAYVSELERAHTENRALSPERSPEVWRIREELIRLVDSGEALQIRVERDLVANALKANIQYPRSIRNGIYHTLCPLGVDEQAVLAARQRVDAYRERQTLAVQRIIQERQQAVRDGTIEPVTVWVEASRIARALAQESYRVAGWYDEIDAVT